MPRKWRIGVAVVVGLVSLAVLSPLFQRVLGRHRLRFPYLSRPLAEAEYGRLAARPGWAKAQALVAPGVTLRGLVRRPAAADAPWVLFYPGNDESQLTRGQAFLSALGEGTDWGLAVFAYRGYDSSAGQSELVAMADDAPQILARLCETERIPPSRVHVAGFSIGGHFAVHAARGAARSGKRAASLTLLASVDDIVMFQRSAWEKLSPGEDYQTRPLLADVPAPVLVLQGSADEALVGPGQGRDLAQALGARATYREFAGVKHVELLFDAAALDAVQKFIRAQPR